MMGGLLGLQRLSVGWLIQASALAMAFRPRVVVDGFTLDRHIQAMLSLSRRGGGETMPAMPDIPGLRRALETVPELMGVDRTDAVVARDIADGPVPMRLFTPAGLDDPSAMLVFLHGGGWIAGSIETYDRLCRHIAETGGLRVLSVEYRLAPEHPFPAGFDDAQAAFSWALGHAASLGADPARMSIGGDSAGGGLSVSVCVARAAAGEAQARSMWLLYPAVDLVGEHPSMTSMDGYVFTREALDWIVSQYVPNGTDRTDPRLSPGLADIAGLPPAHIVIAGFDPLRDGGAAFAARMGGRATLTVAGGLTHGFADLAGVVPAAKVALDEAIRAIGG